MKRRVFFRVFISVIAVFCVSLSWSLERRSLERANRLQRLGEPDRAAALYLERTRNTPADPELRYNLGTALLAMESPGAETEFALSTQSGTRDVRGRAHYNTALLRLERAIESSEPDSIRVHAGVSVDENRAALRLRPEDQNAKWNLAMALRLLDSIDAVQRTSGRELTDGAVEADVVTRSINVPDAAEDERAEDPPAEGENETVAAVGDESPLSPDEAASILSKTHLDATQILGKLLALESRSRWGRQLGRGVRRW